MGTLQALDEAALQLFIDKDDVHSLRIENEKLREKLRQFNQVDMKKSADLKVFKIIFRTKLESALCWAIFEN